MQVNNIIPPTTSTKVFYIILLRHSYGMQEIPVMLSGGYSSVRLENERCLLSALRAMPVCRVAAHILAIKVQKANINAGVPQGSVLAPTLFLLHINDLLSSTTNRIHSFVDDSALHAGIMSNRPISVVEFERKRLAMAASPSKERPLQHGDLRLW
nr:unnamed protein product [Callosobruchus chinensis]